MTHKGILVFINQETGEIDSHEMTLPMDTYVKFYVWGLDFWRAFIERPKIFRWIARLAMGRYAYRELQGLRQECDKRWEGNVDFGYGLEDCDYHKDKVKI